MNMNLLPKRMRKTVPDKAKMERRKVFVKMLSNLSDELSAVKRNKSFAVLPDDDFAALQPILHEADVMAQEFGYTKLAFRANTLNASIDDLLSNLNGQQIRFYLKRAFDDFTLELQRASVQENERATLGSATLSTKPIVLVVDDESFDRKYVERTLGKGYKVIGVANVKDALRALHKTRPDVIVLDVHMPGMPGTGFLNFLKDVPDLASIPVLMRSGDNTDDTVVVSMVGGALDYLPKDIGQKEMADRIQGAIESGNMRLQSKQSR